jgi:hypothetical protein
MSNIIHLAGVLVKRIAIYFNSSTNILLVSRIILGILIEKSIGTHGLDNVAEYPQTLQFG